MPVHDWTRVDAGLFHHFHQMWAGTLCTGLNTALPSDYYALIDQRTPEMIPDVITLRAELDSTETPSQGGVAVAESPPKARIVQRSDADTYASRANRIAVRHRHGDVVAIVEIVSPGNKHSQSALETFVDKSIAFLRQGIQVLIIDLLPPTRRDPQGIHKAIWTEFEEEFFELPADKPLTAVSYSTGPEYVAYVEPFAVGDLLPEIPLFLRHDFYIPAPLESSYQATWRDFPARLKALLEPKAT